MSFALAAGGLLVIVLGVVALPLFRGAARPLGRGLEDDGPVLRWQAESVRLIGQLRDNDLALAEGRIDPGAQRGTAIRLGAEAEGAVAALKAARNELSGEGAHPRAAPHPVVAGLMLAAVAVVAVGVERAARLQDVDLTGSPHADGRIPLDIAGAMPGAELPGLPDLPPVIGADGTPDIAAMVSRLEARVAAEEAGAEDIKMLLRSYDTLGRIDAARDVLRGALTRYPEDTDFQIGYLRAVIHGGAAGDMAAALPVAERLVATLPGLMEARWYRSLLLVEAGRRDEAQAELMWMVPHLPPDSPAGQAVTALLADLAGGAAGERAARD